MKHTIKHNILEYYFWFSTKILLEVIGSRRIDCESNQSQINHRNKICVYYLLVINTSIYYAILSYKNIVFNKSTLIIL